MFLWLIGYLQIRNNNFPRSIYLSTKDVLAVVARTWTKVVTHCVLQCT